MPYTDPKTGLLYPSREWMIANIQNLPEVQKAYSGSLLNEGQQSPRDLNVMGLEPETNALDSSRSAQDLGQSSFQKFNLALMDLLKRQQGLGTGKFAEAEYKGQEEQAGRIMAEATPGMPPNLQSQIRQAQAGAMQPTIAGAQQMKKTMSEQISGLSDALSQARFIGQILQQEETTKRQEAIDMIYKFPSAIKTLDDKSKKELAKRAGIPIEFIDALPEEKLEQWSESYQNQVGDIVQKNLNTGEIRVVSSRLSTTGDGGNGVLNPADLTNNLRNKILELAIGQQDSAFGAIASFKNAKDIIGLLDAGVQTGPLAGRGQSIEQLFGKSSEEYNQFVASTTAFTANYIKALSGVQVSDKERQFLMKSLPSSKLQEGVNRSNLTKLLDFLKNKYELQIGIKFSDYPDDIPQISNIPSEVKEAIAESLSKGKTLEEIRRGLAQIYGQDQGYKYLDLYMSQK